MLTIKTFLNRSTLYGDGCFTTETLPLIRIVWNYNLMEMYPNLKLGETIRLYKEYGWYDKLRSRYIIPSDNAKFIKFSSDKDVANLREDADGCMRTYRIVKQGEELIELYEDYMIADDIDKYKLAEETYKKEVLQEEEKIVRHLREVGYPF